MAGNSARLVLGTVQLGLPYGIANSSGQPDFATACAVVRSAWKGGVHTFDTAQGYGTSEAVLGRCLQDLGIAAQACVITKLHPSLSLDDGDAVEHSVRESIKKLGVSLLESLFLHREEQLAQLDGSAGIIFANLRDKGLTRSLGISVYSPSMALAALRHPLISRVQLPSNLLDRRFERAGVAEEAAARGKKIDIRSVFLQGLLAMRPNELPRHMRHAAPVLEKLHSLLRPLGLEAVNAALVYIRESWPHANIVLGAEIPAQVEDTLVRWNRPCPEAFAPAIREAFPDVDEVLLNPALWPTP